MESFVGYKQVQQCNTIYIETVADKIVVINQYSKDLKKYTRFKPSLKGWNCISTIKS